MKCLVCLNFSWHLICKNCLKNLEPRRQKKRVLQSGLKVYSFYQYEEISLLLHCNHKIFGSEIFKLLSKITFLPFAKKFHFDTNVYAIGIDDCPRTNYSHTAILAKALKSQSIKPVFGALRAKSQIKYSGKSLAFRKANPRQFIVNLPKNGFAILVDDLITTGTTLQEAQEKLEKMQIQTLFALTLADAQDK